ncbi:MAG: MATE family efflux transporter [Oscillospiraceae bacterium]|nr:MATE family efflux transporter [Oscillospiraceae bacterium]
MSTAMIGRLLAADISAQGICLRITDLMWYLYKGLAVGTTVLVAYRFGEGKRGQCRRVAEQAMLCTVPIALLFSLFFFIAPGLPIRFFTDSAEISGKALGFMKIMRFGFPFAALMCINTAAFHGHGNTRTPMVIAGLVNAVNVVCGYVFIYGAFGVPAMGVLGAALALVVSQVAGALFGLFLLYRPGGLLREEHAGKRFFEIDWKLAREVYVTGIPVACESIMWQLSAVLLSKVILTFGDNSFAAYQLGLQAESVFEMPAVGFSTTATALSSKALGMRDDDLFKAYFSQLVKNSVVISLFTSVGLMITPHLMMAMLTDKPDLQAIGVGYLFVMGFTQTPQNLSQVFNGTIRSAGYKNTPMKVAFMGIWLIRMPLILLVAYVLHWNILFVWICMFIDQISRCTVSGLFYRRKNIRDSVLCQCEQDGAVAQG